MNALVDSLTGWVRDGVAGWSRFWFSPQDPATLALVRILAGLMLLYTHLVWTLDLEAFFGPAGWISSEAATIFHADSYAWSYFHLIDSPAMLWTAHIAALIVFAMLTLGMFTRVTSIAAYFVALAYVHRVPGALFGLDQVNTMLAMYLMIGPCGAAYSVDRVWRRWRSGGQLAEAAPSVSANVAVRLVQVHLCVIYLYSGISKLSGTTWWTGTAMWGAVGNLEYQSIDLTWMADWPLLVAFLTHLTIFWETFYCAMVWPRWSRPIVLGLAVMVHGGIAASLGLATFGLSMIIANCIFLPPKLVRALVGSLAIRRSRASAQAPVGAIAAAP